LFFSLQDGCSFEAGRLRNRSDPGQHRKPAVPIPRITRFLSSFRVTLAARRKKWRTGDFFQRRHQNYRLPNATRSSASAVSCTIRIAARTKIGAALSDHQDLVEQPGISMPSSEREEIAVQAMTKTPIEAFVAD
jgi:hypothetical protein